MRHWKEQKNLSTIFKEIKRYTHVQMCKQIEIQEFNIKCFSKQVFAGYAVFQIITLQ